MIGAIILAAGASRRFGDDKRRSLLPSGHRLLEESIQKAAGVIEEVIVTLRFDDRQFANELDEKLENPQVHYYCAPDSSQGMGSSLANTLQHIQKTNQDWDAALIFLGDMPFVRAETVESLIGEYEFRRHESAPIVLPTLNGSRGHPVLFDQHYFPELVTLSGDQGAKPVIKNHAEQVFEVEVQDPGVLQDIDTPEDLTTCQPG